MYQIYYGKQATSLEITACEDLQKDLARVISQEIKISAFESDNFQDLKTEMPDIDQIIIVGSPSTNLLIKYLSETNIINLTREIPGKRGGIIQLIKNINPNNGEKILILAGSDDQGAQYAVYDFSRYELGVDPYEYWTGKSPQSNLAFKISSINQKVIKPPLVPILGYFDNDNDELSNLTKPYLEFSFEQWKAVINSLIRLKYNAIDIHDHLGRAEFYRWPHYLNLVPNYEPNIELLNQLIDYAHARGVMIQVSFYLGWKFKVISDKASLKWADYKQEWIDVWTYYLEHTPIGKCDIFLNRPRDQRWDRKYKGKGEGNDPATVFNEAFPEMVKVIKKHNPKALVIVDLYSEGRSVYEAGFRPEPKEDYIMAWPDDGFGGFQYMPKDLDGYKFGIYMHAGFFLNHVVQDPYPELLSTHMKTALIDYKMTNYCLVNGQTFRHYLLNMEACSKICENPLEFDPDQFYLDWCANYFGKDHAKDIVKIYKLLHSAQENRSGYIALMGKLKFFPIRLNLIKYAKILPRKFINKIYSKVEKLGEEFTPVAQRHVDNLKEAYAICQEIKDKVVDPILFYDQVELQVKLLLELDQIANYLHLAAFKKKPHKLIQKAVEMIKIHHKTRMAGDKDPKWKGWYNTDTRRPNSGYFDMNLLNSKGKIKIHKNR